MKLTIVRTDKKRYLPLLLEADEEEKQIDTYLERGTLYVATEDETVIGVAVITKEKEGYELKNMAIAPTCRRQGKGSALLNRLCTLYAGEKMYVGTGDSGSTVPFYEACGFRYDHTIPHFFTERYEEKIVENGVILDDMIVLVKECS